MSVLSFILTVLIWVHLFDKVTVTLEIFARVLFSRNFAYHENKILVKWRDHSAVY